MAKKETVISFRGEDNGLSANVEKMRSTVNKFGNEILETALKLSASNKDTVKQIDDQIRAFERKAKVMSLLKKQELQSEYQAKIAPISPNERNQIELERQRKLASTSNISEKAKINQDFDRMLRGPSAKEKEMFKSEYEESIKNLDKEEKLQSALLRDLIETTKEAARNKLREDKKGAEKNAQDFKAGKMAGASTSERAEAKIQADALSKDVTKATSKETGRILSTTIGTYLGNVLSRIGRFGGELASSPTEDHVQAKMWSAIPFVGEALAAASARHLQEKEQVDKQANLLSGITGKRGGNRFGATSFGFDMSETIPIAAQLAKSRGFRGNIQRDTKDIIALEKAYGLDRGTLMNIGSAGAFDKNFSREGVLGSVSNIVNRNFKGQNPDMSRLESLIEAQNQMMQEQSSYLEGIDSNVNSQVISSFQSIGGSFSDIRYKERIASINNALRNPGNEFQQARNYSVLAALNPNADYYQIKEMEEKGITQKGFMSGTLKNIQQQYGNSALGMEAARQRFGLSYSQGRTLWEGFQANPNSFDDIGSIEELKLNMKKERSKVYSKGAANTSELEVSQAAITDKFSEGMLKGLTEIATRTGADIAKSFTEAMDYKIMGVKIGDAFSNSLNMNFPFLFGTKKPTTKK